MDDQSKSPEYVPTAHGTLAESALERLCAVAHELKCLQTETHDEIRIQRAAISNEEREIELLQQRIKSRRQTIETLQQQLDERRVKYLRDVAVFGDTVYGVVRSTR